MKIVATGDLHYGMKKEYDKKVFEIAEEINSLNADVLILAGDNAEENFLDNCLKLFNNFKGVKLIIAGNHDIWSENKYTWKIYEKEIYKISLNYGFHYLDNSPFVYEEIGFVGNIGWYDFSFKSKYLNIPLSFYHNKTYPNVATWNDLYYIFWNFSDQFMVEYFTNKLKKDIDSIYNFSKKIICVTHHIGFENLIPTREEFSHIVENLSKRNLNALSFTRGFLGSPKFGEILIKYPKIGYYICAHSHVYLNKTNQHIICYNVGSTYQNKRYIMIEV